MANDWKNKFWSEDGKYYDSLAEAKAADHAWREQISLQNEQNRLIEEQNRLIQQTEYDKMNQELEIENSRQQLQREQMQHEKDMRILKLFDDVGISKDIYDKFISNITSDKDVSNLNTKKIDIEQRINLLNLCLLYEDDPLCTDITEIEENNPEYYSLMMDLHDELTANCYTNADSKYLEKHQEYLNINEKQKKYGKYSLISFLTATFFLFILALTTDSNESFGDFMIFIVLVSFIALICFICIYSISYKKAQELSIYANKEYRQFNSNKAEKNIKEEIKKCQKKLDKVNEQILPIIQKQTTDFMNFRINHYNSKIEKLLIDADFKKLVESYGIEYKSVTNNNKKKDGTIDDYIAYFDK